MKKIILILSVCAQTAISTYAAVSFGGSSLQNVPGLVGGQTGVTVIDTTGGGFADISSFLPGLDINDVATYGGTNLIPVAWNTSSSNPFAGNTLPGSANFSLVGGVSAGDSFAVLLFGSSTSTSGSTVLGDSFTLWTDASWVVPADGSSVTFGGSGAFVAQTGASSPTFTGTVVPEPSAFALLAGCFGLAWVMVRRRS